jgi:hypothetical protein
MLGRCALRLASNTPKNTSLGTVPNTETTFARRTFFAKAASEFAHTLDGRVAAIVDDIGRAELTCQRDPVGMAAEHDDPFGAKPAGSNHPTEADRAISNDSRDLARLDSGTERRVMPVPITSESVSSDGISARSGPTGSTTSEQTERRPIGRGRTQGGVRVDRGAVGRVNAVARGSQAWPQPIRWADLAPSDHAADAPCGMRPA